MNEYTQCDGKGNISSVPIYIGKYLMAQLGGYSDSGKTKIFFIRNTDLTELGNITWNGRWRKYSFNPFENTTYEEVCLRNIADFCEKITREHKKNKLDTAELIKGSK